FLSTLDRATESLANFLRSSAGQTALIDFFREARATLDILGQGLEVAVQAVARFVQAFANTGGLQAFAQGITDIVTAVAPLLPALGELAGNTLGVFGAALSAAAAAITPLVQGLAALLDAAGPIGPAIVAMVVAFRGLNGARAALTAVATSLATVSKTASGTSVEIGAL